MNLIELSLIAFGGGGSYYTPPVSTPEEDTAAEDATAEEAAKKEKLLARKRKGQRSTILTSALGLSDQATTMSAGLKGTLGE